MLQFEELRLRLEGRREELDDLAQAIGYEGLKRKLAELEEQTTAPGFWNDVERSQKNQVETARVKGKLEGWDRLDALYGDTLTLIELANEEEDESVYGEALADVEKFEQDLETQKLATLLTGEYDVNNAIMTFHAGAGGTEAQDWASMLYRMYTHWTEQHGLTYKILDYLDGDEAGIKSASILVEGENAYGMLKSENGVHRLVRVSPFDANARRQTSFAAVEVIPEITDDSKDVEIRPEDIEMQVYRSSGAGGQHINKTSSAVRLIHIPTGIVTQCQNDRSQHKNKDQAMKQMKAKLYELEMQKKNAEKQAMEDNKSDIGWGSQIRSYVLDDSRIKDLRTGVETRNTQAVLDGSLDQFIEASLKAGL